MKIEQLAKTVTVAQAESLKHIFARHVEPAKAGPFTGLSVNDWLEKDVSPSIFGDTVAAAVPNMVIVILNDGSRHT